MAEAPAPSAHRVLASQSRVEILELLRRRASAVTVGEISQHVHLHHNTVREHLDRLIGAGLVESEVEARHVRGRPRLLYRALEAGPTPGERVREDLVRALVHGYAGASPEVRAEELGRAWAATRPGTSSTTQPEAQLEAQLDGLVQHFAELGFAPELAADGTSLALHRCPVAALAVERPDVVCAVHLGQARGILDQIGGPVAARALHPGLGVGPCTLVLGRED